MKLASLGLWMIMTLGASTVAADTSSWEGKTFPDYQLANQTGAVIDNSKFNGRWVLYYFYPKDNTPGCSIEADNFAKRHEQFVADGLEIVGISLDDVESHAKFAKDFNVKFDLLADVDKALSEKLDMVNILPWPHTRRESFLVNAEGIIVKHYPTVNPREHVEQVAKDFAALSQPKDKMK
ncbi:MAG: peroxiredoxin [Gammaproteobacteria bacterium]|nr:peroxiredoxin [Gammaproteobacteria bacterium]NVK89013.1 peroxiredoxin [Gammaproteobacteria bacterium]